MSENFLRPSTKRGQRVCSKCFKTYNNKSIPRNCQCGYYLGGTLVPKEKEAKDSYLITPTIASVRSNLTGVPLRCFVNLTSKKVSIKHRNIARGLYSSK